MSIVCAFNNFGLFNGALKLNLYYKLKFYERYVLLYDYLFLDLNKSIYLIKGKQLRFGKKVLGSCIFIKYYFLRRNLRVVLHLSGGYVFYNVTGGFVSLKILGKDRLVRRKDRRGFGVVSFLQYKVIKEIRVILLFFRIRFIKMFFCTYFKQFIGRRIFYKSLWFYLKRCKYIFDKIPRAHNSLDSGKRWRKRPRK